MAESFASYYRRMFRVCGKELWSTWRTEAWPTVLIALGIYAITRHQDLNAWKTFLYTAEASGLYLGGWSIYHLIRAPWKLSAEIPNALPPVVSTEQQVKELSTAILDFIYQRALAAPQKPPIPPYEPSPWSSHVMLKDLTSYNAQMKVVNDYDADTLGIFQYKFSQRTEEAIEKLRHSGLFDPTLEAFSPAAFAATYLTSSEDIKKLGESLREQAVDLEKRLNVSQKPLTPSVLL